MNSCNYLPYQFQKCLAMIRNNSVKKLEVENQQKKKEIFKFLSQRIIASSELEAKNYIQKKFKINKDTLTCYHNCFHIKWLGAAKN